MDAKPKASTVDWDLIQKWLGTAFILYWVLYGLSMIDFSFLKGEIIAYSLECEVKPEYNSCPGKTLFVLRAHYYKPNVERQEVLSWTEGFAPDRLTKCAVVNRTNWKCDFNDESSTFGFENGNYFNYPKEDRPIYKQYYVPRSVWIRQSCQDSIFDEWYCIPLHSFLRGG